MRACDSCKKTEKDQTRERCVDCGGQILPVPRVLPEGFLEPEKESSNVWAYRYQAKEKKLQIFFKNGMPYEYQGVEESDVELFKQALSPGTFLNIFIKPNHDCIPLTEEQLQ